MADDVFFSFFSSKASWKAEYPSFSLVFTCVTTQGPASITVHGKYLPLASKKLVIPTFLPINPDILFVIYFTLFKIYYLQLTIGFPLSSIDGWAIQPVLLNFDLYLYSTRKFEFHQRINSF